MDPVAFKVFGIEIMWYSILITIGIIIGAILAFKEAERLGIGEDNLIDLLLYAIPLAVLGARIHYIIFTWDYYSQNPKEILHFRGGRFGYSWCYYSRSYSSHCIFKEKKFRFLDYSRLLCSFPCTRTRNRTVGKLY